MARKTLNLGILAHVDAGKTTLTERLLHAAGVIAEPGSVDKGTTQTDTLALERERGITIRSAVVSFEIGEVTVNLIDTPGHPDFIAEVERVLNVLDGAVLVVSAVEGVQPQTRILMRALQRLAVPTLVFVNKVDRAGADEQRVLREIAERLTPAVVALASVRGIGTRTAQISPLGEDDADFVVRLGSPLAELDEGLLTALVDDEASITWARLQAALAEQTSSAALHPVLFGSALTGAGVEPLMAAIAELLPARVRDAAGAPDGTVFKIERGPAGEKVAYVRMVSGSLATRNRVRFGEDGEAKVTAVGVFDRGGVEQRAAVRAGEIAVVRGLADVRIGDRVGEGGTVAALHHFAPPTLESVVVPIDPAQGQALRVALDQLAEQDPLIAVRQDDTRGELSVSLYGEVQKEVVQATLARDHGLEVTFGETSTICVERPAGAGESLELLQDGTNPFHATIGLRIEPAAAGSGVEFRLEIDRRELPLHIYKTAERFREVMAQHVRGALREGLSGWQVTDCVVTLRRSGYYVGDGAGKETGAARTTAADFRKLTPIVLLQALRDAGSVVCEPVAQVHLELPPAALGAVLPALARLGASVDPPGTRGELATVEALLPSARVHELQRQLPGLSGGEGTLEATFAGYQPVAGDPPTRRRLAPSPLNRAEYLLHLAGRAE